MSRNPIVSKCTTGPAPGRSWPDVLDEVYADTTKGRPPVGFRLADNQGRVFYLCDTDEAITKGDSVTFNVAQVAIAATKFDADPIGATELALDVTVTDSDYVNGVLCITEGTSAGEMYFIVSNTGGTAGTTDSTVKIEGGLRVALSASDSVGYLMNSLFMNVTQHNQVDPCVEVGIGRCMGTTSSTNKYCWVQTWGPCVMKASSTNAVNAGDILALGEDAAGTVESSVAAESPAFIGVSPVAIATSVWGLVFLTCFP